MKRYKTLVGEKENRISEALRSGFFNIESCGDKESMLQQLKEERFDLLVVDRELLASSSAELLTIKEQPGFPAIIAEAKNRSRDSIVEAVSLGADEWFVMPVSPDELQLQLQKSAELATLRGASERRRLQDDSIQKHYSKRKIIKSAPLYRRYSEFDRTLLYSLKSSLNQGAGLGSLVSIAKMIAGGAKKDESGKSLVSGGLIDLLSQNADVAERTLQSISDLYALMDYEPKTQEVSVGEFYNGVCEVAAECERYLPIKNQTLSVAKLQEGEEGKTFEIDIAMIKRAARELILNALKFSGQGEKIEIVISAAGARLYLSVINTPEKSLFKAGGDTDYEKVIFEPFYRLANFVFEEHQTLDLGLGLTLVEKAVCQNNGTISAVRFAPEKEVEPGATNHQLAIEISFELRKAN